MVLYYNQNPPIPPLAPPPQPLNQNPPIPPPPPPPPPQPLNKTPELYARTNQESRFYQDNRGLLENLSQTFFGDAPELYSRLLQEDFSNLSIDEKLDYLFKFNVMQNKTTSKYMRIGLFLLVLILFKLYFSSLQ